MNKKDKAPEEIAKDLEAITFEEIDAVDLKELFASSDLSSTTTNCNCQIGPIEA